MTMQDPAPKVTMRTARGEADYWKLRQFLLDTWGRYTPFYVWDVRRLDGAYWHNPQPGWGRFGGGELMGLWFDAAGQLAAAVHPEDRGEAWLQVAPAYRWLQPALLDWAEEHLALADERGRRLRVFCWDYDEPRRELLRQRGYAQTAAGEVARERPYPDTLPPAAPLPAGYRVHTLRPGDPADCARYAALLNDAFKRTLHSAEEIASFVAGSPSFRADLEMIAAAPDKSFAALAGMIYDHHNRYGLFEPVCATRGPRPLGLTGRLMLEGWRRVRERGAEHCYVQTSHGLAANRFYAAAGFAVFASGHFWDKQLADRPAS